MNESIVIIISIISSLMTIIGIDGILKYKRIITGFQNISPQLHQRILSASVQWKTHINHSGPCEYKFKGSSIIITKDKETIEGELGAVWLVIILFFVASIIALVKDNFEYIETFLLAVPFFLILLYPIYIKSIYGNYRIDLVKKTLNMPFRRKMYLTNALVHEYSIVKKIININEEKCECWALEIYDGDSFRFIPLSRSIEYFDLESQIKFWKLIFSILFETDNIEFTHSNSLDKKGAFTFQF